VAHVQELAAKLQGVVNQAARRLPLANGGKMPPNEAALLPYFDTPQSGADFAEYLEAKKAADRR